MVKRKVHFTLDCAKPGSQFTVEGLHVGDKRSCEFRILLRNGIVPLSFDDENIAVIMNAQKPDGTTISTLCDISEDKKEVVYTLDVQDTTVAGIVNYELIIAAYDGENYCVLYSATFSTVVSTGVIVPVFKKLDSEPADWATDYKKYFRHTQNGYEKITDDTCPTFNSNDFYFLVNPNYDSENDYSAFEQTVANVQSLLLRVGAVEAKNSQQDTAIEGKAGKVGGGSSAEIITATGSGNIQRSGKSFANSIGEGSTATVPTTKAVKDALDTKANSSDVYTKSAVDTALSSKAAAEHTHSQYLTQHQDITGKEDKSNKVTSMTAQSTDAQYPSAKAVYDALGGKADTSDIPTKTSDLDNDSGFLTSHQSLANYYNKTEVDTALSGKAAAEHTHSQYLTAHQDISGKEDKANKVNTVTNSRSETHYPSVKCMTTYIRNFKSVIDEDIEELENLIPTATSELNNDSGFVTGTELSTSLASKADKVSIPFATPEEYGAVGDGVTDDTAAINACLAANKRVVLRNTYAINTIANGSGDNKYGIEIPSNRELLFDKGAKLKCIPNDSSQYNALYIVEKENITIDGMELECDRSREVIVRILRNGSSDRGIGVRISGSENITLKNCEIYNALGDGVNIWLNGTASSTSAGAYTVSKNVRVENCNMHHNRRNGITIGASDGVMVSGCHLHDNGLNVTYENILTNEGLPADNEISAALETVGVVVTDAEDVAAYLTAPRKSDDPTVRLGADLTIDGNDLISPGISPRAGIDIEPQYLHNTVNDAIIENCVFEGNGGFDFTTNIEVESQQAGIAINNLMFINNTSKGGAALNGNIGVRFAYAAATVVGGNYEKICAGSIQTLNVVGAIVKSVLSAAVREDTVFDYNSLKTYVVSEKARYNGLIYECKKINTTGIEKPPTNTEYWKLLNGTGKAPFGGCVLSSCDIIGGRFHNGSGNCCIELNNCRVMDTEEFNLANTGFLFLNNCYVLKTTWTRTVNGTTERYRFCEKGHIRAAHTEFHFENHPSNEITIMKVMSAEFKDCDFFYPDDGQHKVVLFGYENRSYFIKTNWVGNRFHNDLNGTGNKASTLDPFGNNLIDNHFNFSHTKLAAEAQGYPVTRQGNVWTDLNENPPQSAAVNQNGTITFTMSDGSTITTAGTSVIGFSPVATVTQTASGATVSITDSTGTTTANISNGADGQDYVLTAQDKSDIADIVLSELPTTTGVLYGN